MDSGCLKGFINIRLCSSLAGLWTSDNDDAWEQPRQCFSSRRCVCIHVCIARLAELYHVLSLSSCIREKRLAELPCVDHCDGFHPFLPIN
uniref:Uncharacterized protein n=1 Tax=Aegilops tauschii subsp. strangulata TaxID=200361 RepID=A0A452ZEX5_AEGTS